MKIVLIGYMASGKSTIGKQLAKELNISFIDLDDAIEEQEHCSIPEIFEKRGELYFRKTEGEVLQNILNSENAMVLSVGGGTPCYGNNMATILELAEHSIYINVTIPELAARISKEKEHRPLVRNMPDEELPEFIGKHLFERNQYYSRAEHILAVGNLSVEEIVMEIQKLIV